MGKAPCFCPGSLPRASSLWWYLLPLLATVTGAIANLICPLFDSRVFVGSDGRLIRTFITLSGADSPQATSSNLRLDTVTYGLPMLAALVIVTRSGSILTKLQTLALGLGVMSVLTVLAIMAWAKLATLSVDEQLAQSGDQSSFLFYIFHGYAFSQPVVAVLLWLGMLMLGMFKKRLKSQPSNVAVPRNAPCPCGSGQKYKRCCGS
jgi:SEC-C motif-containing protein